MMRVLDHEGDTDARMVAILMRKIGVESLIVTTGDDRAMVAGIAGKRLVMATCPDGSGSVELQLIDEAILPAEGEVFN